MTERHAEFVGQLHEHVLTYIIVAGDEGSSWKSTYKTEAKNVNHQMYFSRPKFISKGFWACLFSTFCYCETWIHMRFIRIKLSPRPSICSVRRHVKHKRVHDHVSFASGNFLASMKREVVEGIDYGATGEVKKLDIYRIRDRLDNESFLILSNLGYSSSKGVLNCKYSIYSMDLLIRYPLLLFDMI